MKQCRSGPAVLAFILMLLPFAADAQGTGEAARPAVPLSVFMSPANMFSLSFDRLYDTYHWTGQLRYRNRDEAPFRVALNDQYLSTVILSDRQLIRDEQSFGLGIRQRLFGNLSAALQESSYVLSDNQNLGLNAASSHALYGGAEYRPFDQVNVEPFLGYRFDNQIEQRDRGPSYLLALMANDVPFGNYQASLSGYHRYDRLDPRILETHLDTLKITKGFAENTRNAFAVSFARNRRDFYFPADTAVAARFRVGENIETRTENILGVYDSLDYVLSPRAALAVQGEILTRGIGRDVRYQVYSAGAASPHSDVSEFRLDGAAQLGFAPWTGASGIAQIAYQERDEEHSLQQNDSIPSAAYATLSGIETGKNNVSRRTSIGMQLNAGLTRNDSVSADVSTNILRYDTPSALNTDDRDELRDIISLTLMHRFSTAFTLWATGEVNLDHLVYLSSLRSADNTWNRIYRFAPRLVLDPSESFSTSNAFEVLANYTIYDYDFVSSTVRSFTFRQFGFTDSTEWRLTGRLALRWYQNMRLYERGELQWDQFSERPLAYFEDHTLIGTVRYRATESLVFSTGIRYFSQSRDQYVGADRVPESFLRSVGPLTTIELNFGRRTRIFFNGWFEHQVQTGQVSRNAATMTMACSLFI